MLQVQRSQGICAAIGHLAIGLWLLFCVLWNHVFCIFTPPGSTLQEDPQVLGLAVYRFMGAKKATGVSSADSARR